MSWVCKFFLKKTIVPIFWDVGHRSGSGRGSSPFAPTQPFRKLLGPPLRHVDLPANPSRFHGCQSLNDTFVAGSVAGSIAVSARIDAALSGTSRDWVALRDWKWVCGVVSSCCPDHFDSSYSGVSPCSTGSGMRTALFCTLLQANGRLTQDRHPRVASEEQ